MLTKHHKLGVSSSGYICHSVFIHLLMGTSIFFYISTIANIAIINVREQISLQAVSSICFVYRPRKWIAESRRETPNKSKQVWSTNFNEGTLKRKGENLETHMQE